MHYGITIEFVWKKNQIELKKYISIKISKLKWSISVIAQNLLLSVTEHNAGQINFKWLYFLRN